MSVANRRAFLALSLALVTTAAGAAAEENPLLHLAAPLPFDKIQPEHALPAVQKLIQIADQKRQQLGASTGPRTWANTMAPLDDMTVDLERAFSVISQMQSLQATPEWRKAYSSVLPPISEFQANLSTDAGLARVVKEYSETAEAKALKGAQQRFVKVTLDNFAREGAYLPEARKNRLKAISVELSALSNKFQNNVLDATNAWELVLEDEARLKGMPESALAAAKESAEKKGKKGYRFTLQPTSVVPVLTYADDANLRETISRAYTSIGNKPPYDNRPVITQILKLRAEMAGLLGFKTFADYQTSNRMAKNGLQVTKFLSSLEVQTRPAFTKEKAALLAYRRKLEGPKAPPLRAWDVAYYSEKLRKERYNFDSEALRPYYEVDNVIAGLFSLANKLYGITLTEEKGVPVWHPSVRYFNIQDKDGSRLGSFYMDLYPRETKRGGAWMSPLIKGGERPSGFAPNISLLACNAPPPTAGKPALFPHREVETLFHEFGHMMHHSFSRSPIAALAGTEVAWDFVELPSQLMENFTYERQAANLYAKHYQTGEQMPADLFDKMVSARNFMAGHAMMRQLSLGTTDILLHSEYQGTPAQGDPVSYARKVATRFAAAPLVEESGVITSFGHVFSGGYAAGYYSYKWAEALDADAFTRFKSEGILNPKVGEALRRDILEKGNTDEAGQLFRSFMGRDPDPKALLRRSGLAN